MVNAHVLNMVNNENSPIKYKLISFPCGQHNTEIDVNTLSFPTSDPIEIRCRINNFIDLEILICLVNCLRRLKYNNLHLFCGHLMGARSDRQFAEGGNSYLVDVIAPLITAQNFESVTVLDVHNSDVTAACIKNLEVESNLRLVKWAVREIYGVCTCGGGYNHAPCEALTQSKNDGEYYCVKDGNFILISPDDGSRKKIQKVADSIGYKGEIITCSKARDTEGNLTKTVVPASQVYSDSLKDHIIIDDLIDGGQTFINIAKELKSRYAEMNDEDMKGKLYLIVTHGIFSKDFEELSKYFDGIYCTNSYKNIDYNNKKTADAYADRFIYESVKQLNIF